MKQFQIKTPFLFSLKNLLILLKCKSLKDAWQYWHDCMKYEFEKVIRSLDRDCFLVRSTRKEGGKRRGGGLRCKFRTYSAWWNQFCLCVCCTSHVSLFTVSPLFPLLLSPLLSSTRETLWRRKALALLLNRRYKFSTFDKKYPPPTISSLGFFVLSHHFSISI